ncbi:uncharacterized protein [Gossypium hirsutum]|uniref:Tf2-1-like SH3-like domain-containing protein n=1 Tax=Gossypium hirsutum TaxID=3635 RepID=A0A1U8I4Z6_GOSHI|nr:uncharacterized protein LOC107892745 [Gossypium hirsutum]
MTPDEALYRRKCRTLLCWTQDKVRLIRYCLKAAFDRNKSYLNLKRRDIEYFVGDYAFLKVSPLKKVHRFGCKGKFSPGFIGSYRILKCVRSISYQLELPLELNGTQDVFHASMLRQNRSDPSHIVSINEIEVRLNLSFEEEPVQILDRVFKLLRRRSIHFVKVLWQNHGTKDATWEPKDLIQQQHPHLFESSKFKG